MRHAYLPLRGAAARVAAVCSKRSLAPPEPVRIKASISQRCTNWSIKDTMQAAVGETPRPSLNARWGEGRAPHNLD